MRRVIAVALLCISFAVASQPPIPAESRAVAQPHANPREHQNTVNDHDLISAPSAAVARQSIPKVTAESGEPARDYFSPEWWLVYITGVLCAVTSLLAWYTRGLFSATVSLSEASDISSARQAGETKEALDISRDAANAARISAEAAGKTAAAASKAAQVAEDTLISANRPWILICDVRQRRIEGRGDDVDGGYNLDVSIKNVGNSPATCIFANAMVIGDKWQGDAHLQAVIQKLRPDGLSKGITLVPNDSVVVDAYCLPDDRDPREQIDLGLVVCCVFYSFPFKAGKSEGCIVSIYRATKESLVTRDLKFSLDKRYTHSE